MYYNKEYLKSWLKITRFQFYPMTWLAYTVGSLSSYKIIDDFNLIIYIFGYIALFLIEFATVISNEYYDYETDRINKNYSQFTGGSRMLVDGKITFKQAKRVILVSLALVFIISTILTLTYNIYTIFIMLIGMFLGLTYTVPPFKLSYRGLGELDVGVTHSFYILLVGFLLQSPKLDITIPILISIPLFFAIFGAIILGGFPDNEADKKTGKKTITVILGQRKASIISIISISLSIISGGFILFSSIVGFGGMIYLVVIIHGLILLYLLVTRVIGNVIENRVDKILQTSLSYIMWFTIIPLLYLLNIF